MPRIPEAAVETRLSTDVGIGPGSAVGLGREAAQLLEDFAAERLATQREAEFVKLAGEMTGAVTDLQLQIEQDPDANTVDIAQARFSEGAEVFGSDIIGRTRDKTVEAALQKRLIELGIRGHISVGRAAFGREVDAGRAGTIAALEQEGRAYALAESDEDRALIAKNALVAIDLPQYFTKQEQENLRRDWLVSAQTGQVLRLIDLERFDEAQTLLDDREKLLGLDEKQRASLETTLRIAEERTKTELKSINKAARTSVADGFVKRIYGEGPALTVPEIRDSILEPGEKEHYIDLLEKRTFHPELNRDHPTVVRRAIGDIRDGRITDPRELDALLYAGLSQTTHSKLVNDLEERQKPEYEYIETLSRKHFQMVERTLFGTEFNFKPLGAERSNAYYVDKTEELRRMKAAGATPAEIREVFDPNNPKYLGKDLHLYQPNMLESIDAQIESITRGLEETTEGREPVATTPQPPSTHPDARFVGMNEDGVPMFELPNGKIGIFKK